MQKLVNLKFKQNLLGLGTYDYPEAPEKCPHKGCLIPKKMKKHGFYRRYLITLNFKGWIKVRRYKCTVCGKTVSMLPFFCIPRFTYSADIVLRMLKESYTSSVRAVIKKWNNIISSLTRRHLTYYRARLRKNRRLIQFVLNQISPEYVELINIPGDSDWAKGMLLETSHLHPHVFNADFHNRAEKSFMSTHNMIT